VRGIAVGTLIAGTIASIVISCRTGTSPEEGQVLVEISGLVTDHNGTPVGGVSILNDDGTVVALSDEQGSYSFQTANGWSGSLSPAADGFAFSPVFLSYEKLETSLSGQDLTALDTGECVTSDLSDPITMEVRHPNGGETFRIGQTITMGFCSDDALRCRFIETAPDISVDGGMTWHQLDITPDYICTWAIPATITGEEGTVSLLSDQCMIRLMCYDEFDNYDISDGTFSILAE
jgi:hypothetical protein